MGRFLVAGLIGGWIAFAANMLAFAMIDQLNQKLPKEKQFSLLWYGSGFKRQHRELYPESKLVPLLNACSIGLIIWFLVSAWVFIH
jgi:hypothetical protein